MKAVRIAIKSSRGDILQYRQPLEKHNFAYDGTKFVKTTRLKKEVNWAKQFCKAARLTFFYDNPYGERSKGYRQEYFKHNKPDRKGRYQCVYCGKKLYRKDVTVDHLYPVAEVSQSLKLQRKLSKRGIPSLNGYQNLVAACWKCNSRKGTDMGMWIVRGRIGRNRRIWTIRKLTRFLLILAFIYLAVCCVLAIAGYRNTEFLTEPLAYLKSIMR